MSFWEKQRVVVTGGAGFLGQHVVRSLAARGAGEVFVPRQADYDLREKTAVLDLLNDTNPTLIIHLAALVGGIGANQNRPAEFFYDNAMMDIQLLHQSWRANVAKFVAIGTVCSYPKFTPVPFREVDLWNGYPDEINAPYGLAKKMLLVQSQTYRDQYGYNSICLLPVNLYGPGDNFDTQSSPVIPALIRKCLEAKAQGQEEIVAWGDGLPTREFLYVADAAEGILLASEHYNQSEPVNLGSGHEVTIRQLLEKIVQLTGFQGKITWDTSKPTGQPRRALDTQRAFEYFGFRAATDFEDGLRQTIIACEALLDDQ